VTQRRQWRPIWRPIVILAFCGSLAGCHSQQAELPALAPRNGLLIDPGTEESHACRISCEEAENRCLAEKGSSFEDCRRKASQCLWLCPGVYFEPYQQIHAKMTAIAKTPTVPPAYRPLPPSMLRSN
jgi:hypothetical protein